jgi:rRNA maturation endonuclease Nob1
MFAPPRRPRPKYLSYCGTCGHHYHVNRQGHRCAACGSSYIRLTALGKSQKEGDRSCSR